MAREAAEPLVTHLVVNRIQPYYGIDRLQAARAPSLNFGENLVGDAVDGLDGYLSPKILLDEGLDVTRALACGI